MSYSPQTWADGSGGGTPISAARLTHMETGIEDADTRLATLEGVSSQPLDADLTAIAALDSSTAGALVTDGSGWIRKTYAQLKTALGLVKADVGLGNADNTSDANKPVSTATQTALDGKANSSHTHVATTDLTATGTKDSTTFLRGDDTWAVPPGGGGGGGTVTSVTAADGTITVAGTATDPTIAVGTGIAQSKVTNLTTDLAAKQPLDSDLTTIASLTATTDNVIQSVGSAWASRTPAQLKTTLALAKGDVGLGNVDNTSDATKNSATATLTNKRITKRAGSTASTATLTFDADSYDVYTLTAQAAALSLANPSGTPTDGQVILIRIKDNGTARALTWSGSEWRAVGVALPSTTVISKWLVILAVRNQADTKWDVLHAGQET